MKNKLLNLDVATTEYRHPVPPLVFTPVSNQVCVALHALRRQGKVVVLETAGREVFDAETGLVLSVGPECKSVRAGDCVVLASNERYQNVRMGGHAWTVWVELQLLGWFCACCGEQHHTEECEEENGAG